MTQVAEALADVHQTGERQYETELYRLKGELLLQAACGMQNVEVTPEACFQKALDVGRQ